MKGLAPGEGYPFTLPSVRDLDEIRFPTPVTFFAGENGSGKSTLLEAIAAAANAVIVGGADLADDPSMAPARELADHLTLVWRKRTHRGFFMRSEDLLNFGVRTTRLALDLAEDAARHDRGSASRAALEGQARALAARYGPDLNAQSHGESFLALFRARFAPGGLYLLDEPDTALSPQRQLALVAKLMDLVAQDAQFIIATHSPIVLAFPDATILAFDGERIVETAYDDVPNVRLTRHFLGDPEAFPRRL